MVYTSSNGLEITRAYLLGACGLAPDPLPTALAKELKIVISRLLSIYITVCEICQAMKNYFSNIRG